MKSSEVLLLLLRATFHTLPLFYSCACERKFYARKLLNYSLPSPREKERERERERERDRQTDRERETERERQRERETERLNTTCV